MPLRFPPHTRSAETLEGNCAVAPALVLNELLRWTVLCLSCTAVLQLPRAGAAVRGRARAPCSGLSARSTRLERTGFSGCGARAYLPRHVWGLPGPRIASVSPHWQADSYPLCHQGVLPCPFQFLFYFLNFPGVSPQLPALWHPRASLWALFRTAFTSLPSERCTPGSWSSVSYWGPPGMMGLLQCGVCSFHGFISKSGPEEGAQVLAGGTLRGHRKHGAANGLHLSADRCGAPGSLAPPRSGFHSVSFRSDLWGGEVRSPPVGCTIPTSPDAGTHRLADTKLVKLHWADLWARGGQGEPWDPGRDAEARLLGKAQNWFKIFLSRERCSWSSDSMKVVCLGPSRVKRPKSGRRAPVSGEKTTMTGMDIYIEREWL